MKKVSIKDRVKLILFYIAGHRQSPFSMVVQNRTMELTLSAEPRNLDIHPKEDDTRVLELTWQPPKVQNGRITGK